MRLWELEAELGELRGFQRPNVELEQYSTSAHLAARLLHCAHSSYGDVAGRCVADFGCGSGVLAVGASLLGAAHVVAVDVDPSALRLARENAELARVGVDLILGDVTASGALFRAPLGAGRAAGAACAFHCVVMNPPFGTRQRGQDLAFVRAALRCCGGGVYSLHKSSTRAHVREHVSRYAAHVEPLAQMRFDLPRSYAFHRRNSVDVEVDLWRFADAHGAIGDVSPPAPPRPARPAQRRRR